MSTSQPTGLTRRWTLKGFQPQRVAERLHHLLLGRRRAERDGRLRHRLPTEVLRELVRHPGLTRRPANPYAMSGTPKPRRARAPRARRRAVRGRPFTGPCARDRWTSEHRA
eukprot:scaffold1466_cov249-Pinguiococcus_pyrenoidosus.AAC.8